MVRIRSRNNIIFSRAEDEFVPQISKAIASLNELLFGHPSPALEQSVAKMMELQDNNQQNALVENFAKVSQNIMRFRREAVAMEKTLKNVREENQKLLIQAEKFKNKNAEK